MIRVLDFRVGGQGFDPCPSNGDLSLDKVLYT